ncbi:hypothetical protein BO86DRAFT_385413 [Aspergillus japonicus CBS 114.51]|uniref:Uncharacterized protein n=1 Tax=Aspergillus japonicus CBS 114.51 TaxID=1448312 RepID=A0A8T8XFH6_ASPJA|nr:hypothetical protein BO86DRAFT_385413 [Aspergillus japonicus CBS 114.51]RAH86574.1 hypothetical protein BO86DRAFT_385413 [Aspergillus japonicus CBS 114.51]
MRELKLLGNPLNAGHTPGNASFLSHIERCCYTHVQPRSIDRPQWELRLQDIDDQFTYQLRSQHGPLATDRTA